MDFIHREINSNIMMEEKKDLFFNQHIFKPLELWVNDYDVDTIQRKHQKANSVVKGNTSF